MIDANALAGYRRAIARRGQPVIVRRVNGDAPNTATFDARVPAIVMDYVAKQPVAGVKPEGDITLGARNVILLEDDLRQKRFPLPVTKNDKVIVLGIEGEDEELNIMELDPNKRRIAGAIDIVAEGA
jgi:hypothetical protein